MQENKLITLSLVAMLGVLPLLEAGKISGPFSTPLVDQAAPSHSSGFGGWNLGNVNVKMTDSNYAPNGKTFDKSDGSYDAMVDGDSFESDIYDSLDTSGTVMVNLHGKDWPVGEPAGIKVITANTFDEVMSHSKPASCIMTTSYLEGGYLDAVTPTETLCSSPFQSHKRFKLNMLPTMVGADGAYGTGVNLTFNVQADVNTWRYMVLQKINNYTGKRLDGFKVEVGFLDAGGVFTTALANGADIRLSIGTGEDAGGDIWAADELATFSHGLFGAADDHFPTNGFFDSIRAGYAVTLNGAADTIEYTAPLGSNYISLPVQNSAADATITPLANQFGNWLPSTMVPKGIFYDDDNDPSTDAELMAFWAGYGNGTDYGWMKGDRDNFAPASALELATWASHPLFNVGEIEDVLNLGLNYIVEIGDTSTFPVAAAETFTIRITPHVAPTSVAPGYIANPPGPFVDYVSDEGSALILPEPTFVIGNDLTLVVADSDLNANPALAETIDVNVTTSLGEYEIITLTEIDVNRAVFTAQLSTALGATAGTNNDGSINVDGGTLVTLNYLDTAYGSSGTVLVTATTTAEGIPLWLIAYLNNSGSDSKWYSVNDTASLLFSIFGFLVIGGLIARRKLA